MKTWRALSACALVLGLALSGCGSSASLVNQASNLSGLVGANPNLSSFMGLVQAGGLTKTLSDKSPMTILAPSNDAIAALPKDVVDNLMKPENKDQLAKILKGHMIPGSVSTDKLLASPQMNTLGETMNVVQGKDGRLTVNGAKVVDTVKGSNGMIHTIDKVILPQ